MNWKRPFRALTVMRRGVRYCPKCHAQMTDFYESGPQAPLVGAFTICWQCEEFLRLGDGLKLRSLTADDKRTLDFNPGTVAQLDQLRIQIAVARTKGK